MRLATTLALGIVLLTLSSAQATISTTGVVWPSDPASWTSETNSIIGGCMEGLPEETMGDGTLAVDGGSDIFSNGCKIGINCFNGTATFSGAGTTWTTYSCYIGSNGNSTGKVTISQDATWTNSGPITLADMGAFGELHILSGGSVSSDTLRAGRYEGSFQEGIGSLDVSGTNSTLTVSNFLSIEKGSLNISDGASVSCNGAILATEMSQVMTTISGTNTTWTNSGDLDICNGLICMTVQMEITDGATVSNNNAYISHHVDTDAYGSILVSGEGSTWTNNGFVKIGVPDPNEGMPIGDGEGDDPFEPTTIGIITITDHGLVSIGNGLHLLEPSTNRVRMSTGGKLALLGDADDSLSQFCDLINGNDNLQYWNESTEAWADLIDATNGVDYMLTYQETGNLTGYTILQVGAVPEPSTAALLFTALLALGWMGIKKK
ncbi:MAG: PEP-CTERM sorting domain-containing protein [Planctomycetia bacterium]|jgi:T5SS/PEP-CTERM-associated repeat protein